MPGMAPKQGSQLLLGPKQMDKPNLLIRKSWMVSI